MVASLAERRLAASAASAAGSGATSSGAHGASSSAADEADKLARSVAGLSLSTTAPSANESWGGEGEWECVVCLNAPRTATLVPFFALFLVPHFHILQSLHVMNRLEKSLSHKSISVKYIL